MNVDKFIELLVDFYTKADHDLQKEKNFENNNIIISQKQTEKDIIFKILEKVKKDYVFSSVEDMSSNLMSMLYSIRKEISDFFNVQFHKNTSMTVRPKTFDEYELMDLCERIFRIIKLDNKE
jgi:hypothetical protein